MTQLDKKKISKMLQSGFRDIPSEQIKELIDIELAKDESEIDTDYIDMCFELLSLEEKLNKNTIKFRPRKAALIAAIISFVILATGIFTASAAGQQVIQFIVTAFSDHTKIEASNEGLEDVPQTIETEYTLHDIPEGFVSIQYDSDDIGVFELWENEKHEQIMFSQEILNIDIDINKEEDYYEEIEMNGYPAYIYGSDIDNGYNISFSDGKYWFDIMYPAEYKDDLITIAQSIKIKE